MRVEYLLDVDYALNQLAEGVLEVAQLPLDDEPLFDLLLELASRFLQLVLERMVQRAALGVHLLDDLE